MTKKMQKIDANSPEAKSADLVAENIARLKALFPELVTEGEHGASVNVDVLKQLVGDQTVTDADEKYGLNWFGKRKARQLALTSSLGTLRPCPEESVDWETTQNLMIEGDNLEVLKLLQKSYAGKVKLIYIDPPYNTGKDFVYPDDFRDGIGTYQKLMGWRNEEGERVSSLARNSESSGRHHTDWLNMILPRIRLARNLLREDGVLAISIDENEVSRLREVCSEIFGEENELALVSVQSNPRGRQSDTFFATVHEYILIFSKDFESCTVTGVKLTEAQRSEFSYQDENGKPYRLLGLRQRGAASRREDRPDMFFPIYVNPNTLKVSLEPNPAHPYEVLPRKSNGEDGRWMWGKEKCQRDINLLVPRLIEKRSAFDVFVVDYLERDGEERFRKLKTIWDDKELNTQFGTQEIKELLNCAAVSFPKPVALLQKLLRFSTKSNDYVLDFFAGSGTTGHAAVAQNAIDGDNRRYILIQLPEPLDAENKEQKVAAEFCDSIRKPRTIAEVTKERLRRAGTKIKAENPEWKGDTGFRVFKLDSSNLRAWDPDRNNLEQTLLDHAEHVKPDRTENDLLYELLLKLGLDLCVPMEKRHGTGLDSRLRGNDGLVVHSVGGGVLMACLAADIDRKDVEALAQGIVDWHKELAPVGETTCVFRDSAFPDEASKANMTAILEQAGITHVRSL